MIAELLIFGTKHYAGAPLIWIPKVPLQISISFYKSLKILEKQHLDSFILILVYFHEDQKSDRQEF